MDWQEVLARRRMVRHYTEEAVTPGEIDRLVAAALRAPSAGFTQGFHLLVLDEAADRDRFWATTGYVPPSPVHAERSERMRTAPLLLVPMCSRAAYERRYAEPDKALVDEADKWAVPYWYVDAAFAAMLVLLEAVDLGLGALFMGVTPGSIDGFRGAFAVPDEFEPIGVLLVGHRHPEVGPAHRRNRRRPPGELVSRGRFGTPRPAQPDEGSAG